MKKIEFFCRAMYLILLLACVACNDDSDEYDPYFSKMDKMGQYLYQDDTVTLKLDIYDNNLSVLLEQKKGEEMTWTTGNLHFIGDGEYKITMQDKKSVCKSVLLESPDDPTVSYKCERRIRQEADSVVDNFAHLWKIQYCRYYYLMNDEYYSGNFFGTNITTTTYYDASFSINHRTDYNYEKPTIEQMELNAWGSANLFYLDGSFGYALWEKRDEKSVYLKNLEILSEYKHGCYEHIDSIVLERADQNLMLTMYYKRSDRQEMIKERMISLK